VATDYDPHSTRVWYVAPVLSGVRKLTPVRHGSSDSKRPYCNGVYFPSGIVSAHTFWWCAETRYPLRHSGTMLIGMYDPTAELAPTDAAIVPSPSPSNTISGAAAGNTPGLASSGRSSFLGPLEESNNLHSQFPLHRQQLPPSIH
jgi:hypothetical protein